MHTRLLLAVAVVISVFINSALATTDNGVKKRAAKSSVVDSSSTEQPNEKPKTKKQKNALKKAKEQFIQENKPKLPSFLESCTDESRREYFDLENNSNIKKNEKAKVLTAWSNRSNVSTAYDQYMNEQAQIKEQYRMRLSEIVKNLSAEAQKAHEKIQAIVDNMNITQKQETNQINNTVKKLDPEVWSELSAACQKASITVSFNMSTVAPK